MENIIDLQQVEKRFGNETALADVTFQVKRGEIFGFLGPSGSGKTTTIKILTGQLAPTAGSATVFDESVQCLKQPANRKRFGVLTDNSGLYGRLSIHDNLKLYCDLYDVPRTQITRVLAAVQLQQDQHKRVSALSKGMTQRVVLARALLHEPELLFLDEPTSALDPVNTMHIYDGLRALNERGTTIFLTTHDMSEAETLCDRVAFLNNGSIQLIGSPNELKKRFSDATLTAELKNGTSLILPAGAAGAQQLFDYMQQDQIESIHSNEPTLGDIFIQVTGRKLA
ncbi:ABC transporter ATP-binding protein [Sporosarcina trichiuri]|uniref:ABC transporter ATP-binding protein n=1 Tax=Sporosarcina trichiuri TaxID=3056445 RepID=UPI0025B53519|nr:ABC transporter ATP-binding protein [Sporosarcina sp. 0.2-SM1T-5]WJY27321.1 ABC transporter ATP-binding protein [Sporosarcina sp. 0.2-SM1T-5]